MEDISTQFLSYLISQQNSDISDFFTENDELINIMQDYFLMLYQIQNQKYVGTFCNLQNCIQFVQKETYYKLLKQKEDQNEQSLNSNTQSEDNKNFSNFPLKELSTMLRDKEKIDLKNIFKQCIKYSSENCVENPYQIESIEPNFTKVIQAHKHNDQLDKNPYSVKEGYLNSIYNEKKKIDFSKENVIDLTDDSYQRKQEDDDRRYNYQQLYNQKNMVYDYKQQDKRHFANNQNQSREMIIIDGESNKNYYQSKYPNRNQDSRPASPNRRSQERKSFRNDYFDQKNYSQKQDNNRQIPSSQYNSINSSLRERDRSYNNKVSEEYRKQQNNVQNNKFQNNQKQYQGYNNQSNKYNFNNSRQQDYRYNRRFSQERGDRRSQSRHREEETPLRNRPKGNDWDNNHQKKRSSSSSSSSGSSSSKSKSSRSSSSSSNNSSSSRSRSVQRNSNKRSDDQSYQRKNSSQFSASPQHKSNQSPHIRNRNESDPQSKPNIHSNQRMISDQQLFNHQNRNKSLSIPQITPKTIANSNQAQQFKQIQQNKFIGQKLNGNGNFNIEGNGSNQDKFQFQNNTRMKPLDNFQYNFQPHLQMKPPIQIINPVIQQNGLQQFPNNLVQAQSSSIENPNEVKGVIQQQLHQEQQKFQNFPMYNSFPNPQQAPLKSNPFCGQPNLLAKSLEKQQSNN
ncbi:hypothetical protein ABPG74_012784 [Tetrahymena malaccensis]